MTLSFGSATGIPDRNDVFELSGEESKLQPFLTIQPPEASLDTAPVLSFERKRSVDLPWAKILENVYAEHTTSMGAVRTYFEKSWGLEKPIDELTDDDLAKLHEAGRIRDLGPGGETESGPENQPAYRTVFADDGAASAETLTSGIVLEHGSGRLYLVQAQVELVAGALQTADAYRAAWKDAIIGVELVFSNEDDAKTSFTDFSEVDLRPAVIHKAYQELLILRRYATATKTNVADITKNLIKQVVETSMDPDELDKIQRRSLRLEMNEFEVQRRIDRLVGQAAELGFYLFPDGGTFKFPDKSREVLAGQIYTKIQRLARWATHHVGIARQVVRGFLFSISIPRVYVYQQHHSRVVEDYQLVDTSKDALGEKQSELLHAGMQVFTFQSSPRGFETREGINLRTVMAQCEANEDFRRRCAVLLPVYEQSLIGVRALTKYSVFLRPLPGVAATTLPRLSLIESLSYRTSWTGTRLGELVNSINLAPGESRTVFVSKEFKQQTNVTRSSTSIFDVNQSESTDLATEMEDQAREESEQSSNLEFSAKVSGGTAFVSGEASASGGTSSSLSNFSQAISKVARKAAQSINRQQREEVSSSSSAMSEVTNRDEMKATIKNVNEGRTLNLMFYRLHNEFDGGLFLDELQWEVLPGVEAIAGSGVYESTKFALSDAETMLNEFGYARLPFDLKPADQFRYMSRVVDAFEAILRDEYGEDEGEERAEGLRQAPGAAGNMLRAPTQSVGLLRLPPPKQVFAAPGNQADEAEQEIESQIREMEQRLDELEKDREALRESAIEYNAKRQALVEKLKSPDLKRTKPMQPQTLLVASGGLYLDTVVGALPGTEPYSEEMRRQEVRMRAAEVFLKASEGIQRQSQAGDSSYRGADEGMRNRFILLKPEPEHDRLTITLKEPLSDGRWHLLVDGEKKRLLKEHDVRDGITISLTWPSTQAWLAAGDVLRKVALYNEDTGTFVSMV